MNGRGGKQRIPRPSSFRDGDPAPWATIPPQFRCVSLADVRAACATLPARRSVSEGSQGALDHTRPAAVLIPIFEEDGLARIILTKRPATMPTHKGEIAFPGGKLEPGLDADLQSAALREAQEEIGLDPAAVEIAGELDHMVTVAASFALAPFVGLLASRPVLVPDPREVDLVFDVAIAELLDDAVFREERWDVPPEMLVGVGPDRAIHFFELAGETVWGATAKILTGFLEHLTANVSGSPGSGSAGVA